MSAGQATAASAGKPAAPGGAPAPAPPAKEYTVRVNKNSQKRHSIMKFNIANKVDFTQCSTVKVERENNLRDFKAAHDIDLMPKFGAGSEFGREQKDEARRKKYGMATRKYNPYNQPWLMKLGGGKQARKFKGTKEGGILENTSYFVFTQCADGAFEASPVEEWYNFNPAIKYRYLNSEEAEEEYSRRDRNLNFRNLMLKKRLLGDDAEIEDEDDKKSKKKKKKSAKEFKLTEMEDWAELSDSGESNSEGDEDGDKPKKPKKQKDKKKSKKSRKANSDDEALEESDDQNEGVEVDYMTSSDSEDDMMFSEKQRDQDKYEEKGVAEEKGLKTILDSDESEEDEEKKQEDDEDKEEEKEEDDESKEKKKKEANDSDSESSDSSDSDSDPEKETNLTSALFMGSKVDKAEARKKGKRRLSGSSEGSAPPSRSATPSVDDDKGKRSATASPAPKKLCTDSSLASSSAGAPLMGSDGITDEAVRRYLMRKPMTTKDLLQKFKSKNTGLSKEKLVTTIAQILKRLNPDKHKIKDKLYLFIKKQ